MTAGYPLQLVAVDIVGPLTPSKSENTYILVASDYFTRWVEAYAIPNQEAVTVANKLVDEFFCRFSVPEQLHSDQGRQFEANVMQEVCRLLQIDKTRTTPYHPQSDGLVERFNRTMLAMLASTVEEDPSNWEQHLRKVCMAYNTSVHPSTGYAPFYLMFGRLARLPVDIMYGSCPTEPVSPHPCSGGYRFWGGARMVGVAGGGVGFWPDTKSGGGGGGGGAVGLWPDTRSGGGGGGGVLSDSGPKRRAGGGGGGGGAVGFWPDTKGGGGEYDRVSGGPGYSTVVEFMRADINRQRNRAAIL